jgi:hypothetical protein
MTISSFSLDPYENVRSVALPPSTVSYSLSGVQYKKPSDDVFVL